MSGVERKGQRYLPRQAIPQLICGEKASQVIGAACVGHRGRRQPGMFGEYQELCVCVCGGGVGVGRLGSTRGWQGPYKRSLEYSSEESGLNTQVTTHIE